MLSTRTVRRSGLVACLALLGAVSLAACGSSSSTASSGASTPSASPIGLKVPVKTIGVWQSQADGEGEEATLAGIKAADAAVGWKTVVTDANGSPTAMASTMESLIGQHVDAIFTVFVATGLITPQLAQAKAAGIPVISVGYQGTPSPDITAEYAPDQTLEAQMLLARMHQDLPGGGKIGPVAVQGYFGIDAVLKVLHDGASADGFTELNPVNAPGNNVFNGETQAALSLLNGNPKLAAFYSTLDIGVQTIAPALSQTGRKVPIYGFSAINTALPFIRSGQAVVVTSDGTAKAGFIGVDALLAFWIDKTPIPTTIPAADALQYKIVDKTNAPPNGQDVFPMSGFAPTFTARWKTAYGATGS